MTEKEFSSIEQAIHGLLASLSRSLLLSYSSAGENLVLAYLKRKGLTELTKCPVCQCYDFGAHLSGCSLDALISSGVAEMLPKLQLGSATPLEPKERVF